MPSNAPELVDGLLDCPGAGGPSHLVSSTSYHRSCDGSPRSFRTCPGRPSPWMQQVDHSSRPKESLLRNQGGRSSIKDDNNPLL